MVLMRKDLEALERRTLAPYACFAALSRWRVHQEEEDQFMTCFQKDIYKITQSNSFRRLNRKTQVYSSLTKNDHVRNRLTHSFEVAQISRIISRNLWLNGDLSEVIALSHDIGHSPFGHEGQDALSECTSKYWFEFEHNAQTRRILELLEFENEAYPGLNLTIEVLEWLWKSGNLPYLEAQVVDIADEIAYITSDLDDWLRTKVLDFGAIYSSWLLSFVTKDFSVKSFYRPRFISEFRKLFITDIIFNTWTMIQTENIRTQKDVEVHKDRLVTHSQFIQSVINQVKKFLFDNYYKSEEILASNNLHKDMLTWIFGYYMNNQASLPQKSQERINQDSLARVVADYISSMTDSYLIDSYYALKESPNEDKWW